MGEITAELVMELRDETNLGMMECKKALVEAGGDKAKAVRILRERGTLVAQKKASREANQGLVVSFANPDGKIGSL
ncbi:MAG: elongation factor Ts, partial [bacterium]